MNLNQVIRWFDLNSRIREKGATAKFATPGQGDLPWFPQYLALAFGVFLEPFLAHYRVQGTWDFTGGWGRVFFAAIVAFAIFPQIYKTVVTEQRPRWVQLGPIFTAGLGWQTLMGTALKALG